MSLSRKQVRTLVMIVREFLGSRPAPVEFDGEAAWARHTSKEDCSSTSLLVVASVGGNDGESNEGEFVVEVDRSVRDCDGEVGTRSRYLVTVRRKAKRRYVERSLAHGFGRATPVRLNCTRVQEWAHDAYAEPANY